MLNKCTDSAQQWRDAEDVCSIQHVYSIFFLTKVSKYKQKGKLKSKKRIKYNFVSEQSAVLSSLTLEKQMLLCIRLSPSLFLFSFHTHTYGCQHVCTDSILCLKDDANLPTICISIGGLRGRGFAPYHVLFCVTLSLSDCARAHVQAWKTAQVLTVFVEIGMDCFTQLYLCIVWFINVMYTGVARITLVGGEQKFQILFLLIIH